MSWTRYLLHDFWTAREFNDMEARMVRQAHVQGRARLRSKERVEELEHDLGQVTLLACTLAETCIAKGLFTRDEMSRMKAKMDLADGVEDGRLDPKAMPGRENGPAAKPE